MKFFTNFKFFILIAFFANVISCAQDPFSTQEPQIRFVDLQGNPRKIRLNTPTENAVALTQQGKITEEKLAEEKNYEQQQKQQQKNLSYNKYSDEQAQKNALAYTVNMPTEENNSKEIAKEFQITKEDSSPKPQLQVQEQPKAKKYSGGSARIISETKIPANGSNSASNNYDQKDLRSGTYVQAGSFTTMKHAQQHLDKVRSLTNNPRNVNIQSAKVRNKNYYRVVIGPITQKQTAKLIIKDLKEKGQNSIIIKIR